MTFARSHQLPCGKGLRVSLTHYAGSAAQPAHRHDFAQLSFLLAGSMAETFEGRDFRLEGPSVGYKPAGSLHGNAWGREGALIFSITLGEDSRETAGRFGEPGWRALGLESRVAEIVGACFDARETLRSDAVQDVLALALGTAGYDRPAPPWLETGLDALREQPELSIDEVARAVGVDRSHLTRMFQRHCGIPPSVYRRRILAARAAAAIVGGAEPLSRIAHEAGFSDQAHMVRTLRSDTGLKPGHLRRLLIREITSIQDHFEASR